MTDSPLDNLEFSSDSDYQTPDEFLDIIHDPDVLYHYINDAHAKTQQDLTVDAEDLTDDVRIHSKVEVFQSAMQYVEAFGIYLLAYIKGHENLVDDLIKTSPSDVETFFDHLQNDQIDEWLTENGIDDDYQNWNADTEQVTEAIEQQIKNIDLWLLDGILGDGLWTVFNGSRLYMTESAGSPEYHDMPELSRGEKMQLSSARSEAHATLGHGLPSYNYPHTVHYVLDVEFDASTLDEAELFN